MIKRVFHAGEVYDSERAIGLYNKLGFEVEKKFEKPEPKASIAIVRKGETAFELMQFHDKYHPYVTFFRNHKVVVPITEGVIYRYLYLQDPSGSCYEIDSEKQSNSRE